MFFIADIICLQVSFTRKHCKCSLSFFIDGFTGWWRWLGKKVAKTNKRQYRMLYKESLTSIIIKWKIILLPKHGFAWHISYKYALGFNFKPVITRIIDSNSNKKARIFQEIMWKFNVLCIIALLLCFLDLFLISAPLERKNIWKNRQNIWNKSENWRTKKQNQKTFVFSFE